LALVAETLPALDDDLAVDLVEVLANVILDKVEELRAVTDILSLSMAQSHRQHREIARLDRRLAVLLDAERKRRASA
jgi:hypothetical protein